MKIMPPTGLNQIAAQQAQGDYSEDTSFLCSCSRKCTMSDFSQGSVSADGG